MEEQSMRQIVERCQQGDREAFGLLYAAMSERLCRVCRRYVADEEVVNDLLHDTFILIISKIKTLKEPSNAEAWMQKVAQNLSLTYLQKQKQQSKVSLDGLKDTLAVAAPAAMPITYDEIMNLVDTLPKSYQRVFRLSVLEGLSHQEIAALLNIEPHTSSVRLFRAKQILRQSLAVLLLSLLAICLPLGLWYALRQPSEDAAPLSKDAPSLKPVPVSPVIRPTQTPYPSLTNSMSVPHEPNVRPTRTLTAQPATSDTLSPFITEKTEAENTETRPMPAQTVIPPMTPDKSIKPASDHSEWMLALAYSGMNSHQSFILPYGEIDMNDLVLDTITHHRMPLTIALQVNKMLNKRLSIGSGLQYTQLYSETHLGNTYAWDELRQRLHYLGIPLRMSWYPVRTRHWSIYGSVQALMEVPLKATQQKSRIIEGVQVDTKDLRLHPSLQWSVGIGAGLEYRLTPVIGIYAEPSIQYFFKTGDAIDTWRTAHPATFSVPFGIRITIE